MQFRSIPHDTRYSQTANAVHPAQSGWGIDMRSLPAHTSTFSSKESKSFSSTGGFFVRMKARLRRFWSMQLGRTPAFLDYHLLTVAPSSSTTTFVLLCTLWYSTSALANNTGKVILMQFRHPITLTLLQFGFVVLYCFLFMSPVIKFSKIRRPTKAIIKTTLPMGMFQVIGHVFASVAISRIPVSTVHTIKALSPLFTVAAYALLYGISYSTQTYLSLFPLTIGVMLACSFDMSASNFIGVLAAFGSAVVFVSQNIFFKKVVPPSKGGSSGVHKLDKLNILLYSSGMAFVLTLPLWFFYEAPHFIRDSADAGQIQYHPTIGHNNSHSIGYYIFLNGVVHFAQNIIAFVILGRTSPVTYSIASLIKRVAVICIAIIWFNQAVHPLQAFGIVLTTTGLYMYNNTISDVDKGEKKIRRVAADRDLVLPTVNSDSRVKVGLGHPSDSGVAETTGHGLSTAGVYPRTGSPHTLHQPYNIPQDQTFHHHLKPILTELAAKQTPVLTQRIMSPVESYPSPPDSPLSDHIFIPDRSNIDGRNHFRLPSPIIAIS